MAKADFKLVRREEKSGKIEPRPRGRQAAGYEYGYVDAEGTFHLGDVPKRRGRKAGRPKGAGKRSPGRPKGSVNKRGPGRPSKAATNGRGLGEIEAIVRREVETRLKRAKSAAIAAFEKALG